MSRAKRITSKEDRIKQTMFKVPIKNTDTASVSLMSTLNNVLAHNLFKMVKTRKIKVKSIKNEEIIMTMIMTKTIITQMIITIMMRMRIKIGNRIKI